MIVYKSNPYENSRPLDIDLVLKSTAFDQCAKQIFLDIKDSVYKRNPSLKEKRLITNLKVILINLGLSYLREPDKNGEIRFSRSSSGYPRAKYNNQGITRNYIVPLVDALIKCKYVTQPKKGVRMRNQPNPDGIKYQSRLTATPSLIKRFKKFKINFNKVTTLPSKELIVLKSKPKGKSKAKTKIDYEDNSHPEIRQWRIFLKKYNKLLSESIVTPRQAEQHLRLYRVFNNESWTEGGRFHGGFWQNIKSEERYNLKINHNETCELDYKSMHPSILYHKKELERPGYIYQNIPGLSRELVKAAFQRMLNCKGKKNNKTNKRSRRSACASLRKACSEGDLELPPGKTEIDCLKLIEDYHASISDYFYTGVGLKLQYEDSQVMEQILKHFTDKGILVLPIHDSCIIEKQHRDELEEIMIQEFKKQFKFEPRITHK